MSEIDKALLVAIEQEKKDIKKDCAYFINEYGWVQDKDNAEGKEKFHLWSEQRRALDEIQQNRLNIILKARQLGITWLVLWYSLFCMLHNLGYTVVGLSKKDDDAKELINRLVFMLEQLPKWLIIEAKTAPKGHQGLMWEATAHEVIVIHPGGEDARFIAMSAAKESGRSFTATLVIIDEWAFQMWAEEIFTAAYPTINRPTGGKVIGLSTAKRQTLFERIWEKFNDFGFHRIFLSWRADPRRTDEWYAQTKKALASGKKYLQEYPSTPEEAFSAGEGTSFTEFSTSIHVCEPFPIPKHWRRWMSADNGHTDPFAWYWYAVDEDGTVYVYREYSRIREEEKVYYTDQASKVKELMTYTDIDDWEGPKKVLEPIDFCVTGLDAWSTHHRDQSGKDLIDYYREGGLNKLTFTKAVTDRKLRKATVLEYLKPVEGHNGNFTAKVQIFDTCKLLIENLPKLLNDEKDSEKVADSAIDNQYDSFGYGLIAYHIEKSKVPKENRGIIDSHKSSIAKKSIHTVRKRLT